MTPFPCRPTVGGVVVAYQLSLFGERPKAGRWCPVLYGWTICGRSVPLDADAVRQYRLLYPSITAGLFAGAGSGEKGK